jgi:hypothetical protein
VWCFLCGTKWIPKHYFEELRLQRFKAEFHYFSSHGLVVTLSRTAEKINVDSKPNCEYSCFSLGKKKRSIFQYNRVYCKEVVCYFQTALISSHCYLHKTAVINSTAYDTKRSWRLTLIKSSRAISHVSISVPNIKVMTMRKETVPETLENFNHLTWPMAREVFINTTVIFTLFS